MTIFPTAAKWCGGVIRRTCTIAIVILSLPGFVLVVLGMWWVVSCDWLEEKVR